MFVQMLIVPALKPMKFRGSSGTSTAQNPMMIPAKNRAAAVRNTTQVQPPLSDFSRQERHKDSNAGGAQRNICDS